MSRAPRRCVHLPDMSFTFTRCPLPSEQHVHAAPKSAIALSITVSFWYAGSARIHLKANQ